ncbi:MAG: septal ring lytic transglycosylase RlpA family protein [Opitutales bacterium]|nr:septal ring lytic transglycosylase RlpA family protein [Opitutales bacterium]
MFLRNLIVSSVIAAVGCSDKPSNLDHAPQVEFDVTALEETIPETVVRSKGGNRSPYEVNGVQYEILPTSIGYREKGLASWYGMKYHGRPTANGEVFDVFRLTAAHPTLPIPCYAKVINLANGQSTVVRINDRGPFVEGRILDLSWAAAKKIGMTEAGLAEVEIEVLAGS